MKTEEGQDYWSKNGTSVEVEFDLAEGSHSRDTLSKYLEKKGY